MTAYRLTPKQEKYWAAKAWFAEAIEAARTERTIAPPSWFSDEPELVELMKHFSPGNLDDIT